MVAIEKDGEIKIFSTIPNTWNHTVGYNYENPQIHYKDGFRNIVEPQYDISTQYKGEVIYDSINDIFTYNIINFTEEQLSINLILKEEIDDKNELDILEEKGTYLYVKTKNRLIRKRKKGLLSRGKCKILREILHPIFLKLKTGDIDLANDLIIQITTTPNQNIDINNELVWFKDELIQLKNEINTLL